MNVKELKRNKKSEHGAFLQKLFKSELLIVFLISKNLPLKYIELTILFKFNVHSC
jgi:hypothetical protein